MISHQRQNWVLPYIHQDLRDRVVSAVYRKYSADYLKTCFSVGKAVVNSRAQKKTETKSEFGTDPNYDLYMYMGQ